MTPLAFSPGGFPDAPKRRWSGVLGGLAFALFLASLALPAASMIRKGGGYLVELNGAFALYVSVASAVGCFVEGATKAGGIEVASNAGFLVCGAAALFNVLFLLPLTWLRRSRDRSPSRGTATAGAFGLALAVAAALAMRSMNLVDVLGVGYFVWLAAWLALGAAMLAARREAVTP